MDKSSLRGSCAENGFDRNVSFATFSDRFSLHPLGFLRGVVAQSQAGSCVALLLHSVYYLGSFRFSRLTASLSPTLPKCSFLFLFGGMRLIVNSTRAGQGENRNIAHRRCFLIKARYCRDLLQRSPSASSYRCFLSRDAPSVRYLMPT